jgi:nitroreductase
MRESVYNVSLLEGAMIEILRTRRSIRKYEKKSIDEETLAILKEALLRCPSSRGINSWTFIFVDEPEILLGLSRAKQHGSDFLKSSALGVVVCGDATQSDVWVEDCSIASIVVQLVAHSLGLGSCWIQIRNRMCSADKTAEDHVRALLNVPNNLKIEAIISLGYPAETKEGTPLERLDYGKIKHNRYS